MHHRDQRFGDGGIVEPGGAQHGAGGRVGGALLDGIASHEHELLEEKIRKPGPQKQKPRAFSGAGSWFLLPGFVWTAVTYTTPNPAPDRTVIRLISTNTTVRASATRGDSAMPVGMARSVCEVVLRCVMSGAKHGLVGLVNCGKKA
jgi:hypothetical protein